MVVSRSPSQYIAASHSTAATTCKTIFCMGFRPSFCFLATLAKSSIKPMTPNSRQNSRQLSTRSASRSLNGETKSVMPNRRYST